MEKTAETTGEYRSFMLQKMSEAAKNLTDARTLENAKEALAGIRRIQLGQPLELRIKACNLAISATCENLGRKAETLINSGCGDALARDILKDLTVLQGELDDKWPGMWVRRFTPPPEQAVIYSQLESLKTVRSHSEYTQVMEQIHDWLSKSMAKKYSLKLRLEQVLSDLLITLVITNQIEEHPEDDFLLSTLNALMDISGITGLGAYGALSFMLIDDTCVRLLLPNRLTESSPPEDFLFSAQAIHDVCLSLPFSFIQNLFEQLTDTLRTCLEKDILNSIDDGEVILSPGTKAEMELLYKIQKESRTEAGDIKGITSQIYMLAGSLGERTEEINPICFSDTTYTFLRNSLRDRAILSLVADIDVQWKVSDFVKGILPLYIVLLSRASRNRRDYWNDPLFQQWEQSIKVPSLPEGGPETA